MGVVYRAHDTKLDRDVALKFLPYNLTGDTTETERFYNEARSAAALTHQNIAVVYEIGEHEGQIFIAMEYVEGQTLKDIVGATHASPLRLNQILDSAIQIAQGLTKAHEHGIVHRDIKPANIMIDKDGAAKILDFGLAKLKGSAKLTKTGSTLGTAAYMSPEQARGEELDHRSDIFSFGTVLYEMLTGKLPFKGEHEAALAYSIVNEDPIPDSSIPHSIQIIIDQCLQKNKDKRYQRASEIVDDIKKVQLSMTTPAIAAQMPKKLLWISTGGILIVALGVLYMILGRAPETTERKSIAVLPFTDLSPQKDQEYFCDGMSEEIINALANVPSLYVASRTSAFQFKGKDTDILTIGERLNVSTVLEGSVRKSGNTLRITAQLINATDGYHLWSETYDRKLDDVFNIQESISRFIVDALKLKLTIGKDERLVKKYTDNLEAYTLYLQGRYYWNMRSEEGLRKSIVYFNQALAQDPRYALAYAGLGDAYTVLADWDYITPKEGYPMGYNAAKKALEIDSTLAEAVAITAYYNYVYEKDYPKAEALFKKSIILNPNYPTAHQYYSEFLGALGRFTESLEEIKKASSLDPTSLMIKTQEAAVYYVSREYNKSIAQLKKVIDVDSNFYPAYPYYSLNYYGMRDTNKMWLSHRKIVTLEGANDRDIEDFDRTFKREGLQGISHWIINWYKNLSKQRFVRTDRIALYFNIIGQRDSAFYYLSHSLESGAPLNNTLNAWPAWDNLRGDARFDTVMKRMKFK